MKTRVIKKIEEIPPAEFNKIFPHVLERYHFFKTLDESKFDQFTFYYILVYSNKELVGCAPCFSMDYSLDTSISGPLRQMSNAIKKAFPNLFSIKLLACGIPMGQGQMGNITNSFDVLEAIEQRMEELARKIQAPIIVFKDFDKSYDNLFDPLLKNGFSKIDSLPQTRLKLDFSDFNEYLKALSSATRYDLRRKLKKSMLANITHSMTGSLDENTLEEVYKLYLQVVDTHANSLEIIPQNFFRLISKNMPKEAKFFLWRINGKLAAFVFCLASEELLHDYYLGLDYTLAHEYHLYFVKFKAVFNWCLENNIKTYEMGATGYEPKRRLNFEFVPAYLYVKCRSKVFRPFFRPICALLKFDNFDHEIKRWKKSSPIH